MGHVLRSAVDKRDKISNNPFRNVLEMFRRYRVRGMEGVKVEINTGQQVYQVTSDDKGYFEVKMKNHAGVMKCFLPDFDLTQHFTIPAILEVDKVVVTDIDDTILISHSTSLLKKLYLLLTKNHQRRKAFEGIEGLYHGLIDKSSLLFYVSSSEWNLYDFLDDFMSFNGLPEGVFLLQDLKSGIRDLISSGGGNHSHKKEKIERLIASFPNAEFILIGDSGQKDPVIYQSIVDEYPGIVRSVYIRDVRKSRRELFPGLVKYFDSKGVEFQILSK
tara:strand:+ start:318 stop:1139 length:822 start_codon:yes stop_codon:yes gene_type:complete